MFALILEEWYQVQQLLYWALIKFQVSYAIKEGGYNIIHTTNHSLRATQPSQFTPTLDMNAQKWRGRDKLKRQGVYWEPTLVFITAVFNLYSSYTCAMDL